MKNAQNSSAIVATLTAGAVACLAMTVLVLSLFSDVQNQRQLLLKRAARAAFSSPIPVPASNTRAQATVQIEEPDQASQTVNVE